MAVSRRFGSYSPGRKGWKKKRIGGKEWKREEVRQNDEEVEGGENQGAGERKRKRDLGFGREEES